MTSITTTAPPIAARPHAMAPPPVVEKEDKKSGDDCRPGADAAATPAHPPKAAQHEQEEAAAAMDGQTASMTLAISSGDATRMIEASRAFNDEIDRLQREEEDALTGKGRQKASPEEFSRDEGSGKSSVAATSSAEDAEMADASASSVESEKATIEKTAAAAATEKSSPSSPEGSATRAVAVDAEKNAEGSGPCRDMKRSAECATVPVGSDRPTPLHKLLVRAAKGCENNLIESFVRRMEASSIPEEEMETCLLLFLDMDKSTKLRTAFGVLGETEVLRKSPEAVGKGKESVEQGSGDAMECDEAGTPQNADVNVRMECYEEKSSTKTDDRGGDTEKRDSHRAQIAGKDPAEEDFDQLPEPNKLNHACVTTLFKCFLTSISTCIHQERAKAAAVPHSPSGTNAISGPSSKAVKEDSESSPGSSRSKVQPTTGQVEAERDSNASPPGLVPLSSSTDSTEVVTDNAENKKNKNLKRARPESHVDSTDVSDGDWTLSDQTKREIYEISLFAADHVIDHVTRKKNGPEEAAHDQVGGKEKGPRRADSNAADVPPDETVSFEAFGEWYNIGGYSLVPWLELLDLSKWDYGGRAAVAKADNEPTSLSSITEETSSDVMKDLTPPSGLHHPLAESSAKPPSGGSFSDLLGGVRDSRTIVSFDFSGAMPAPGASQSFIIDITEENLLMLRNLVHQTGLAMQPPEYVEEVILKYSDKRRNQDKGVVFVLHRKAFGRCIRELVPPEKSSQFGRTEMENYSNFFNNFFTCFDNSRSGLEEDEVNAKELAVGFSFLCAGNKSAKLAATYKMLDVDSAGYLTQRGMTQYLRSYLTMLLGISLLSSSAKTSTETRKRLVSQRGHSIFQAVENGAKWTQGHFQEMFNTRHEREGSTRTNAITFDDFAEWYTEGGYTVAPWLELLDLNKFLSLIADEDTSVSLQQRPLDILFTFPLANSKSLVVLREDSAYVRGVVEDLGLLSLTCDEIWSALYKDVHSQPALPSSSATSKRQKSGTGNSRDASRLTFVQSMERIISSAAGRNKSSKKVNMQKAKSTLDNFFQSFDLDQVDRVALNQLMGGLTLLCGGKKSTKLAFSFGLFGDSKKKGKDGVAAQLSKDGLFLFFRSFLIVMFSCCTQSLDLSAEDVSRYISDTAEMVAEDVIKYQMKARKARRVNFDHFGEWYNEGGFETAPWLELLDLKKWVFQEQLDSDGKHHREQPTMQPTTEQDAPKSEKNKGSKPSHMDTDIDPSVECPPPPPEDAVDPTSDPFFGDMGLGLVMDGIGDEMDYILQEDTAHDKENEKAAGKTPKKSNMPPPHHRSPRSQGPTSSSLKFHLLTSEVHGGYMISISQHRTRQLKQLITESGLNTVDASIACNLILKKGTRRRRPVEVVLTQRKSKSNGPQVLTLNKKEFDSAMRSIVASSAVGHRMSTETQQCLSDLLTEIFCSFDKNNHGDVNALELACGFTVLCGGRKSDKLEHSFDLIDESKSGRLSRAEMERYLQSFLNVLLSIAASPSLSEKHPPEDFIALMNGGKCGGGSSILSRAIDAGSKWATSEVFNAVQSGQPPPPVVENNKSKKKKAARVESVSFDDFADWYTKGGYSSIPWLELLDLRKWVLTNNM